MREKYEMSSPQGGSEVPPPVPTPTEPKPPSVAPSLSMQPEPRPTSTEAISGHHSQTNDPYRSKGSSQFNV